MILKNPNEIKNIIRLNRFNTEPFEEGEILENDSKSEFIKSEEIDIKKCINIFYLKKMYNEKFELKNSIRFNFNEKFKFEIKLKENILINYNNNYTKKISFENFKLKLKEEITHLLDCHYDKIKNKIEKTEKNERIEKIERNKISLFENSYKFYFYYIDKMNYSEKFFENIIKIYSVEGCLYKVLNNILRNNNKKELEKIKFYYISLLASFQYCNMQQLPKGVFNYNDNYNINIKNSYNNKGIVLYRCSRVSNLEIRQYQKIIKNKENIIRIYNEFISTSRNKEKAMKFLYKNKCDIIEFIYEIKIPNYILNNEKENFAFFEEFSEYPNEEEVLIRSGCVIEIEDIYPYVELENDNDIICKDNISVNSNFLNNRNNNINIGNISNISSRNNSNRSSNVKSYKNKYILNCNLLSFSFESFIKTLNINNKIKILDLNKSNLGENFESMKLLKDFLIRNKTIEKLWLGFNELGKFNNSLELLEELLMENKSIKYLDLRKNSLGKYLFSLEKIKNILIKNQKIIEIDLRWNSFGKNKEGIKYIRDGMCNNNNNINNNNTETNFNYNCNNIIQSLILSENFLDRNIESLKYLKEILIENKNLIHLDISGNSLGRNFEALKILKEIFIENDIALKILNFSDNKIGENINNLKIFEEILINNNKNLNCLKILDLRFNKLSNLDKEYLLNFLRYVKKESNLEIFDLRDNNFDSHLQSEFIDMIDKCNSKCNDCNDNNNEKKGIGKLYNNTADNFNLSVDESVNDSNNFSFFYDDNDNVNLYKHKNDNLDCNKKKICFKF